MARDVPEWIGKTPNTPVPPRVKLRVFKKHGGCCYRSGRKIMVGDRWDCDHVIALINEGENRESNLAPILIEEHKIKTDEDLKEKSKVNRLAQKHLGLKKKTSFPTNRNGKYKKKMNGEVVER